MKKTRLIVLTDISTKCATAGEPDDTQSLIRLFLYSEMFDIRGLIPTYSCHTLKADPQYIHFVIDAYEKDYVNLKKANSNYPTADELRKVIFKGHDECGTDKITSDNLSDGAKRIIDVICESDEPTWIIAWGGVTDLAQALYHASNIFSEKEFIKLKSKMRLYSIGDQYDQCGGWIRENHSDIFNLIAFWAYRGIYRGGDTSLVSEKWVADNITPNGALGEIYPVYNGGDIFGDELGGVKGIKEGDTPSFLYLINNGLNTPEKPLFGSWGGLFKHVNNNIYTDTAVYFNQDRTEWAGVYRYREDFQNDFAARLLCASGKLEKLNYPSIKLNVEDKITAHFNEKVELSCEYNPKYTYKWSYYPEVSDYESFVLIKNAESHICTVNISKNKPYRGGNVVHVILTVKTKEKPYLTKYKRIIINYT